MNILDRLPPIREGVPEAEEIHPLHGLAYIDLMRRINVTYLIPLNWIVRAWRNLLHSLKVPPFRDQVKEDITGAHARGWREGSRHSRREVHRAWEKGYRKGCEDTRKIIEGRVERFLDAMEEA